MTNLIPDMPLIIYHGNCADGFAAAWCFWRAYGASAEYVAGVYQKPPPDVTDRMVYLVDFSYKRDVLLEMARKAKHIVILDHHKSAAADLENIEAVAYADPSMCPIKAHFDMERSGATLTWDYLYPGEPRPLLLGHIEDRDLWRFKLPHTREIQANVFSYPYTFEGWDYLMKAQQPELLQMTVAGAAIERKHHKDIAELVEVCCRRLLIGGYEVPVASLPYTYSSDAGHFMAQGEPFAACYWDTIEGRVFSLRSSDGDGAVDVSVVASGYGGGGHAKAAGFTVPRDHELAKA